MTSGVRGLGMLESALDANGIIINAHMCMIRVESWRAAGLWRVV